MTAPAAASPQTPPAVAAKPAADTGTEYVILSRTDDGHWAVAKRVIARNGDAAIKAHVEIADAIAVAKAYVAVPAKSWKPQAIKTTTVTTLKLEEAK